MPDDPSTTAPLVPPPAATAGEVLLAAAPDLPSEESGPSLQLVDFRAPTPLDSTSHRQLRLRHEEWARSLSTRLSIYLRLDCQVTLTSLEPVRCRAWLNQLSSPAHLTLFALETKTGLGVLEISTKLGLMVVDRLLGGDGAPGEVSRPLTEIEVAVADEVTQILLREWAQHLPVPESARMSVAGHETNSRFVQVGADEAPMLGAMLQVKIKDQTERVQLGVPFSMLEPALAELSAATLPAEKAVPTPLPEVRWNPQLDQVRIPLTARCQDFEVSARRLASLQVGDILSVEAACFNRIQVRLAKIPKFVGRLGRQGTHRAVELTAPLLK